MTLVVEIAHGTGWRQVGELAAGDPAGTMSHNPEPGRREIIKFTCHDDHSVIERSEGGVDEEIGVLRKVTSLGWEQVARLEPGQKIDLWLRTDRAPRPVRIRFRQRPSGAP